MTSRDFCYWLQGFFEIADQAPTPDGGILMTQAQVSVIRSHLSMVFEHEIDPSMGDDAHREELAKIHERVENVEKKSDEALSIATRHHHDPKIMC